MPGIPWQVTGDALGAAYAASMGAAPVPLYGRGQVGRGPARNRGADAHRLLRCTSLASQPEQLAPPDRSLDKHPARWPGLFRLTVHRSMSPTDLFWVSVHRSRAERVRSIVPELSRSGIYASPSRGESRVGQGAVPSEGLRCPALLQRRSWAWCRSSGEGRRPTQRAQQGGPVLGPGGRRSMGAGQVIRGGLHSTEWVGTRDGPVLTVRGGGSRGRVRGRAARGKDRCP